MFWKVNQPSCAMPMFQLPNWAPVQRWSVCEVSTGKSGVHLLP